MGQRRSVIEEAPGTRARDPVPALRGERDPEQDRREARDLPDARVPSPGQDAGLAPGVGGQLRRLTRSSSPSRALIVVVAVLSGRVELVADRSPREGGVMHVEAV